MTGLFGAVETEAEDFEVVEVLSVLVKIGGKGGAKDKEPAATFGKFEFS